MAALCSDDLRDMGLRGRAFYLREMSLDAGVECFERIFQSVSRSPVKDARLLGATQSEPDAHS
jgi:hypothetical protein